MPGFAQEAEKINELQHVINAQQKQLEYQQKQLDEQRLMMQKLQAQIETLATNTDKKAHNTTADKNTSALAPVDKLVTSGGGERVKLAISGQVNRAVNMVDDGMVGLDDEIVAVSKQGITIRMGVREISSQGRDATGVRVMNMDDGDVVVPCGSLSVFDAPGATVTRSHASPRRSRQSSTGMSKSDEVQNGQGTSMSTNRSSGRPSAASSSSCRGTTTVPVPFLAVIRLNPLCFPYLALFGSPRQGFPHGIDST